MEPDSSTRKQDVSNSPRSYRCPVSTAAGSHEDLDKSEHECEATHKQLHQKIDAECRQRERSRECEERSHPKSRNLHHGCITGYERGPAPKRGRSFDPGASGEHPHSKERRVERGRSREHRCVRTPEHICLPLPPLFHSTPVTPCRASTDSLGVQYFDMSRGSLPLDRRSVDIEIFASSTRIVTPSSAHHLVSSSRQPVNAQLDPVLTTSGLTKVQAEEIFLLTREVQTLRGRLALDFIQLSHQEALFHMRVQAAGYEKVTRGRPDRTMAYYSLIKSEGEGTSKDKLDEAIQHLREAGGAAWLDTNSLLFSHALEYQSRMIELIVSSREAIQALHECIWKVVSRLMEDAGKSAADSLGITLHLVDMLPTIPLQLAFNTATAGLLGCAPEVYAAWPKMRTDGLDFSHAPPPGSD